MSTSSPVVRFFTPPVFPSEEETQRARMFYRLVAPVMLVATVALTAVALAQPDLVQRCVTLIVAIDTIGLALLRLCRTRPRLASWLLVTAPVTIVSVLSLSAGGIRSPGVTMFFVFVFMAGLLLGERAAIYTSIGCASIAIALVWIEELGMLPAQTAFYGPPALLILDCLYMGVVITLLHLATQSIRGALDRAESELKERRHAELEREQSERRGAVLESQLLQAQKMEALGQLAGGIAHDFNNILTAIGGNVELVRDDVTDPSVRASLDEVTKAHGRARDLVKQILLFSRQQEAVRRIVDVRPLVDEALKLLRSSLPSTIELIATYADPLPPVWADSGQIHQILMNLGANAEHAMRAQGGGVLRIHIDQVVVGERAPTAGLKPGIYVRVMMRDTGVGMSADVVERIFEPFFSTKGLDGTGLGLSVVHGIVRDHDGAIHVDSEVGKGSTFDLYFPAATEVEAQMVPPTGIVRGAGEHILYVDDEEALVKVMGRVFEKLGYKCTTFSNGEDALHAIRTNPKQFDAIVTDLMMPGISGVELARAVNELCPELPIAVISGYARSEALSPDVRLAAWIHKPPTIDEVSRVVYGMLRPGEPIPASQIVQPPRAARVNSPGR